MELSDDVTVTKIYLQEKPSYLMIWWKPTSFELCIYTTGDNSVWKGKFSTNRMYGLSKNLHLPTDTYFEKVRQALAQQNEDYIYEVKTGFFYWKRKFNDSIILEGFLPVEQYNKNKSAHPDLIEVLLALNMNLRGKLKDLQTKYNLIKTDFTRCLRDTEEFLNLKVEMEKSLCEKFLNLVNMKKLKVVNVESIREQMMDFEKLAMNKVFQRNPSQESSN